MCEAGVDEKADEELSIVNQCQTSSVKFIIK